MAARNYKLILDAKDKSLDKATTETDYSNFDFPKTIEANSQNQALYE